MHRNTCQSRLQMCGTERSDPSQAGFDDPCGGGRDSSSAGRAVALSAACRPSSESDPLLASVINASLGASFGGMRRAPRREYLGGRIPEEVEEAGREGVYQPILNTY